MWLELALTVAIAAVLAFAFYSYFFNEPSSPPPATTATVQTTINNLTDFKCSVAPGPITSPIVLKQSSPQSLTISYGSASLESRGVYYIVTATGPGGPFTTTISGLATTFYNLSAGSTWTITVQPKSKCGDGPVATSTPFTLCNGPPPVIGDIISLPISGSFSWAPIPGAEKYSIIMYGDTIDTNNMVLKGASVVPCCYFSYSFSGVTNVKAKIIASNACGWSGNI